MGGKFGAEKLDAPPLEPARVVVATWLGLVGAERACMTDAGVKQADRGVSGTWVCGMPCSLGRLPAGSGRGRGRGLGGARVSRVYRLWEAPFCLLPGWRCVQLVRPSGRSLHGSAWPWSGWVTGVALVFDIRSLPGHVLLAYLWPIRAVTKLTELSSAAPQFGLLAIRP